MGYLGMVGGPNPCTEDTFVFVPPFSQLASFEDSLYGFTWGSGDGLLTPYLIDAVTLEIEYRPDLAISAPDAGEVVLDDSTMIGAIRGSVSGTFPLQHYTHDLFVISRSGIAIAYSGPQQSVEVHSSSAGFICRIDDTHFVRSYIPYVPVTGTTSVVLETFSVSGGTISLDNSETLTPPTGGFIVTRDPGGGTASIGNDFNPFHYDGSGILYVYTQSLKLTGPPPVSPVASAHFVVGAVPYTPGGGVGTIGTSTRVNDDHDDQISRGLIYAAKIGSSECVLIQTAGGGRVPFYDDGTNMHFDIVPGSSFDHVDHSSAGSIAGDTPHVDYLASSFTIGAGSPAFNALATQSGTSLAYTPIEPIFRCNAIVAAAVGLQVAGVRHGANLGCRTGSNPFNSDDTLYAYRW